MFVKNQPAMVLGEYLIVSDIHIGISSEIRSSGIIIPNQAEKLAERINKLKTKTKTKKLVILGDLKHNVYGTTYTEKKEIPLFIEKLKFKNIIITKGNHDGLIENLITDKRVKIVKYFSIGNYLLTHGHRKVETINNIIMGHSHYSIKFKDKIGSYYIVPVWIIGKYKKISIIMLPSFNEVSGSACINEKKTTFRGPIGKYLKKSSSRAYLLDGTDIGTVSSLMVD